MRKFTLIVQANSIRTMNEVLAALRQEFNVTEEGSPNLEGKSSLFEVKLEARLCTRHTVATLKPPCKKKTS